MEELCFIVFVFDKARFLKVYVGILLMMSFSSFTS